MIVSSSSALKISAALVIFAVTNTSILWKITKSPLIPRSKATTSARLKSPPKSWSRSEEKVTAATMNHSSAASSVYSSWKPTRIPVPGFPGYDSNAPTVLVNIGGELGNLLLRVLSGLIVVWELERDFGVNATMVIRISRDNPKQRAAWSNFQACFPFARHFDPYDEINAPILDQALERHARDPLLLSSSRGGMALHEFLEIFEERQVYYRNDEIFHLRASNHRLKAPLYYVDWLTHSIPIWGQWYHELRQVYQFDINQPTCCKALPSPDETVLHVRDFRQETRHWKEQFHWELGPNRTSYELLKHLQKGDKVAITSRFPNHGLTTRVVEALSKRGIVTRVISNQTSVEDYCFLLHTEKELVGVGRSSFLQTASMLGNASRLQWYQVNRADMPARHNAHKVVYEGLDAISYERTNNSFGILEMSNRLRQPLFQDVTDDDM